MIIPSAARGLGYLVVVAKGFLNFPIAQLGLEGLRWAASPRGTLMGTPVAEVLRLKEKVGPIVNGSFFLDFLSR
ncbi:MAG: hypothetical protein NZ899_12065 [Thermoguttaceae bacterium]|nr:hypothetical protein [Thermoguttaceae bacterium]MDW8079567.1 hypothetical protein [Thermoguttaceae bacterium]